MSETQQLVIFSLAREEYALPITRVQEIIRYTEPRSVASSSPWIRGVINLRGKIVPVCDLAMRLGLSHQHSETAKIAVVETSTASPSSTSACRSCEPRRPARRDHARRLKYPSPVMSAGDVRARVDAAVAEGRMGDRLWLYATYHCNLRCSYCLTESGPRIRRRRELGGEDMLRAVREAAPLGLRRAGVTGGEVFMVAEMPAVLAEMAAVVPTTALTNATLFTDRLLTRMAPLAGNDGFSLQVSLDSAEADHNDRLRGPRNFSRVCEAVPALTERGIRVRIATTVADQSPADLARLCDLHRGWGIPDSDHVIRPVVRRGRAAVRGMGIEPAAGDILPELTITAEGAFLDPFAPTVRRGVTDVDRRVSTETAPMIAAVEAFLAAVAARPGADAERNIR